MNGHEVANGEIGNPSGCSQSRCDMGIETDLTEEIYGKKWFYIPDWNSNTQSQAVKNGLYKRVWKI